MNQIRFEKISLYFTIKSIILHIPFILFYFIFIFFSQARLHGWLSIAPGHYHEVTIQVKVEVYNCCACGISELHTHTQTR